MNHYYKLAAAKLEKDRYTRLVELCNADCRSISDEIRWLIDRESERRQAARTLIDTPAVYETGGR